MTGAGVEAFLTRGSAQTQAVFGQLISRDNDKTPNNAKPPVSRQEPCTPDRQRQGNLEMATGFPRSDGEAAQQSADHSMGKRAAAEMRSR